MGGRKLKVICNKCCKNAPIDIEKSTEKWTVYKTDKPCECGGRYVPDFLVDQEVKYESNKNNNK